MSRLYTSRRQSIIDALVVEFKKIDGSGEFLTNVFGNVSPRLKFWDEVEDFPALHLNAGAETRAYQAGGYKDRFLAVTVRMYVKEEDAVDALDKLIEDVETVVDNSTRLPYTDKQNNTQYTQQITVVSIDTDEGVLEPYGVGEMLLEVRY